MISRHTHFVHISSFFSCDKYGNDGFLSDSIEIKNQPIVEEGNISFDLCFKEEGCKVNTSIIINYVVLDEESVQGYEKLEAKQDSSCENPQGIVIVCQDTPWDCNNDKFEVKIKKTEAGNLDVILELYALNRTDNGKIY